MPGIAYAPAHNAHPAVVAACHRVQAAGLSSFLSVTALTSLTHMVLDIAATHAGTTIEDLAVSHANLVQTVIPDSVLKLVQEIAGKMQANPTS